MEVAGCWWERESSESGDREDDGGGEGCRGEVDEVVSDPALSLHGCAQQAVEEEAEGGGGERYADLICVEMHRPGARSSNDCSGEDAGGGSGQGDCAVDSWVDSAKGRQKDWLSAECLADLGGDRVCCRFGEQGQDDDGQDPKISKLA